MASVFDSYAPYKGELARRQNGSLVAVEQGECAAYGLFNAQDRGALFVEPGDRVYEGMIVGTAPKAGDIDVKLGASWVDPKYYEQFIYELLQTPAYQRSDSPSSRWNKSAIIGVEYSEHTNSFHVSNKSSDRSVLATQKFGSHKMNAYDIFEHILNLQEPKIYKTIEVPDGMGDTKEKRVVDIDATRVVQRKADDMRKAFKDWIFKDPVRREAIVDRYNELFNSIRPREYDGSNLSFPLMTNEINLHDHQKNAIAHAMFGGNTLFAHSVGAGKCATRS